MAKSTDTQGLSALLDYLKRSRGFDFTGYKPASLGRRIAKRMAEVEIAEYSEYVDYLEVRPDEFAHLFNTILINVTAFFRDPEAWDYLMTRSIPQIIAEKQPGETIRVWSAGCATGEEAYSLAVALAEALGIEQFIERVKIYATDVDEEALGVARVAQYRERDIEGFSPELLSKYFEETDGRYTFRRDLRRCVIFGRHDLIQDAPISRIDLLLCRNVMMYFNAETQGRILSRFHFALSDRGILMLGRAETLFTHSRTFTSVDARGRIYSKVSRVNLRDRLLMMAQPGSEEMSDILSSHALLREAAFDTGLGAQLVIDLNLCLTQANDNARQLCNLSPRDLGRPLQDLEVSYRPIELRSIIEQARNERRGIVVKEVDWPTASGESRWVDISVVPLFDIGGELLGTGVLFIDVTRFRRLQAELEHANQELETAYEELQSTNEELETTNEELQSTVEELETTNEELQSTNEELETMNEELQSTNEELQTINQELHLRSVELKQASAFMESILTSLRSGATVLDRDLKVLIWNRRAEDLWGLRTDEVPQKSFLNLDIGLPVEKLIPPIRKCLSGEEEYAELMVDALNRRGRAIQCRVTCVPLIGHARPDASEQEAPIEGVILLMDELAMPSESADNSRAN